jgi:ribose-phosphate pyrophosphokinase
MGGAKRAKNYRSPGAEVVIAYKERKKANVVEEMFLIGDVKERM